MNEGTRLDLQFIRTERSNGNARAVLERAAQVRERRDDAEHEAAMHMAWACVQLERHSEAHSLYNELLDRELELTPLVYIQTLHDYCLLLLKLGRIGEAERCVRLALDTAATSCDSQLTSIASATAAEFAMASHEGGA